MRKRFWKIGEALLILIVCFLGLNVPHRFLPPATNKSTTPTIAPENSAAKTVSCEKTPDLPATIKALLDRRFPAWRWPVVDDEECQTVKNGVRPTMIQGDFNGNRRIDTAVLIEVESASAARAQITPPRIYVVVFLKKQYRYQMKIVTNDGGASLQLMHKGDRDYDYEAQREFTYKRDTIFSGRGMGGMSYLYENGKFRAIITSD